MSLEPGGYANKLGNRYEGRWVARQMLRVLSEQIRTVTLEAVGDEEQGVDVWIEFRSNTRQAQQCKVRNGVHDRWTVPDLHRAGVLNAMRKHLDKDASATFMFVSGVPSLHLQDITESARMSAGDAGHFYRHQIEACGAKRKGTFREFCTCLHLDPSIPSDLASAYQYLKRFHIELWPGSQTSYTDLIDQAILLVDGDPHVTLVLLAEFALENMRRELDAHQIWTHLVERGLQPRELARDSRVVPAVYALQDRFRSSIESDLINGQIIPRSETPKILESLRDNEIVVVHGAPGRGKSGVLLELTRQLDANGTAWLAVRLDRQTPETSLRQFGVDLDLPESPARCLAMAAGSSTSVLILDQLDAIRWTSRHSLGALDVCKAIVKEARSLRRLGAKMSVVLACRTYDMQHDPEIKNWLATEKKVGGTVEIGVELLSVNTVTTVTQRSGFHGTLSERQQEILRSPNHLAMWVQLIAAGTSVEFQNRVQLMRQFWAQRFKELHARGVPESDARDVLGRVVDYMERHGRVSAPAGVVQNATILDALFASGLLRTAGSQITFAHQSYLDFEIASRAVGTIQANDQHILKWLGSKDQQSLFRREQLRQALALIAEESMARFCESVDALLASDEIRFHLKHLCLEALGQIESPSPSVLSLALAYFASDTWREHVLGTVFAGRPAYVRQLIEQGTIADWLSRDSERDVALWLLRSVSESIPDEVTKVLEPYANNSDEWQQRILGCLAWNVEHDSEAMFQLRVRLARAGVYRDFVDWDKLQPDRVLQLLDAILETCQREDFESSHLRPQKGNSRIEHWSEDDTEALLAAVRRDPTTAFAMILRHVVRLVPMAEGDPSWSLELWLDDAERGFRQRMESIPRALVRSLIEAGRHIATEIGAPFWQVTQALREIQHPVIRFILVETYVVMPAESADEVVKWLQSDTSLWRVGTGWVEAVWMPTSRLVHAISPHCSQEVYEQLEKSIIYFHEPKELEHAEYWLTTWRNGYYGDYWGRCQYFLLPALPSERRSDQANGLIGVLNRKYKDYAEGRFTGRGRSRGGFVGSTLKNNGRDMSNTAWLRLVGDASIPGDAGHKWKQIDNDRIAESSVLQFSRNLEECAKREPERFARLALQFPESTHAAYKAAILASTTLTDPQRLPAEDRGGWNPAPIELVEAVLVRFGDDSSQEYAKSFCWLMHGRAAESWSRDALARLVQYARSHPDPTNDELVVSDAAGKMRAATADVESLLTNALNTVRSVATLAIGRQIRHHPELFNEWRDTLSRVCNDASPVVRTAAVEAGLAVLNIDRDFAVELFFTASSTDLRIAASRAGIHFFNCGIPSHTDVLRPIIQRMLNDARADVSEEGAEEATARWIFNDLFKEEVDRSLRGSLSQRTGVAQVAAHLIGEPAYFEKCRHLLAPLFEDEDQDVRKAAASFARSGDILKFDDGIDFVLEFVESTAFRDDPTLLILALADHSGSLIPFSSLLVSMSKQFVGPLRDASRDFGRGLRVDLLQFLPLLLRLYEQGLDAARRDVVQECLDVWDQMFMNRIGVVRELADAIQ